MCLKQYFTSFYQIRNIQRLRKSVLCLVENFERPYLKTRFMQFGPLSRDLLVAFIHTSQFR
jgi:hypothetical protein